jgi:hypothetical protein
MNKHTLTAALWKAAAIFLIAWIIGAHWGMQHQATDDSLQTNVLTHLADIANLLPTSTTVPH